MAEYLLPKPDYPLVHQFLELVNGIDTENPTPADVQALRQMLSIHPNLWRVVGDLANVAALSLINRVDAHPHHTKSLKCDWTAMKDELGYPAASPLERFLIEQIVLRWLHTYPMDIEYTAVMKNAIGLDGADHWERRLSGADRCHFCACESLARIRKLARITPALQVNIAAHGGQQVNIAGEPTDD